MALKKSLAALTCLAGMAICGAAAHGQVVISQVYGGASGGGAPLNRDFVELFNKGSTAVDLTGYSIQYASTGGTGWAVNTIPSGTIQPNSYFLVAVGPIAATGSALPTPDAIATGANSNMAGANGKVAFVSNSTAMPANTCPTGPGLLDFVGYGTANCAEGTAAPAASATTAVFRNNGGCTDTNNNSTDFSAAAPAPRNSAAATHSCGGPSTPPSGVGASSPADACPGQNVVLTITVTPGTGPTSTGITVSGDTTAVDGAGIQSFFNDGTNGDAVAGDNIWTLTTTIFVSQTGNKVVPATISDAQGRTGNASAGVNVLNCGMGGFFSASPVCSGGSTLVTFAVTPAQFPTSTGITATADLSSIGGSATQQLFDNGTNGDQTAGDNTFSYAFTPTGLTPGAYVITATASDSNARSVNRTSNIYADDCINAASTLVISQIYGGGGNSGATYTHDFVELFNRGSTAVSLGGKSIQYASGESDTSGLGVGTDRMHTLPAVTLQPGQYYLIQEAAGAGGSTALPTPDATGAIAMSATRGTIALVDGTTALGLNSCGNAAILDMVGYGDGTAPADHAFCKEGNFYGATTDNASGLKRNDDGCMDTNNNGMNFTEVAPVARNTASPLHVCAGGPPPCGTSDYNGDGDFGTDADIEAFFACLAGNCCATCYEGGSDFNADGDFGTDADIESFFRVLAGGPC